MTGQGPIKAVQTAFDVIDIVNERREARVEGVATALDLPKSTVHNHLKTLAQAGYLINENGRYRIGLRFLAYGERARNYWPVYEAAKPQVKQAAAETGDFGNLLVEERGQGFYIYRTKGDRSAQTHTYIGGHVGERVPLHGTAPGKAILATLDPERAAAIIEATGLPPLTDATIQERGALEAELESIRERGVAFDDEEYLVGLRAVAAPIVSHGEVQGAISLSGPISKFDDDRFRETLPSLVLDAANTIEIELEFS